MKKTLILAVAALWLSACATSHVMLGEQRPPVDPSTVRIYAQPPPGAETIAMLQSSSRGAFAFSDQGKMDSLINRMKDEAASLGANGILLQGIGDQYAGSVGSANAYAYGNSAFATGVSAPVFQKAGSALAIYVPAQSAYAAPIPAAAPPPPTSLVAPMAPVAAPAPYSAPASQPYEPDPSKRCDACQRMLKTP